MRRQLRSLLNVLLALSLTLTLAGPAAAAAPAAAGPAFADMAGHWAGPWVEPWAALGLIHGYPDGTFRPGQLVTRAEMCALLNRALGLVPAAYAGVGGAAPSLPPDVIGGWYEETIATALAAGYLKPGAGGLVRPDEALTRQEMAGMIALALRLETPAQTADTLGRFSDAASAAETCRQALAALVELGHLRGFEDGTLRPAGHTTRAEAVSLLGRALGLLCTTPGERGPVAGAEPEHVEGGIVIAAPGVTLRNTFVQGDLYITAAALGGVTRLSGVVVVGTLYVSGGAGVVLEGSRAGRMVIDSRSQSAVRLTGESWVRRTVVRSGAALREDGLSADGFEEVVVSGPAGIQVTLDGTFSTVTVAAPAATVTLAAGQIGELTISAAASGAAVELAAGSETGRLFVHARAQVTGDGTVAKASVFAAGVNLAKEPDVLTVAPTLVVMVEGKAFAGSLVARREYTFADGDAGWTGGFCDYPADVNPADWGLEFSHADLPDEIGPEKGLLLSGNNHSDDLFMYLVRKLGPADGLLPNTTYTVEVEFDLGTDAPAGAVGIGGAPGEAVHAKVGAAGIEPRAVAGEDGYWRFSVDKGAQNNEGRNAVLVGHVAKPDGSPEEGYAIKTLGNAARPLAATTDGDGNLWVFVGTDSGFEGITTLYYARIQVTVGMVAAVGE